LFVCFYLNLKVTLALS